jgi:hypothetical protein
VVNRKSWGEIVRNRGGNNRNRVNREREERNRGKSWIVGNREIVDEIVRKSWEIVDTRLPRGEKIGNRGKSWTKSWSEIVDTRLPREIVDTQSVGINRHEVENERVLQERSSEPSLSQVLGTEIVRPRPGVDRGTSAGGQGIELRKHNPGRRPCWVKGKQHQGMRKREDAKSPA